MIEKILEKIEQLKVHKAILMLNKHPLCVDIVEMVSKQKVLEIVQEVAKDGGWIPCSSGQMPNECEEVDVTIEEIDGDVYTSTSWLQEGVWVVKKTALQPRVIAWKPKSVPYQTRSTEEQKGE